jgi:hypothetical protein
LAGLGPGVAQKPLQRKAGSDVGIATQHGMGTCKQHGELLVVRAALAVSATCSQAETAPDYFKKRFWMFISQEQVLKMTMSASFLTAFFWVLRGIKIWLESMILPICTAQL